MAKTVKIEPIRADQSSFGTWLLQQLKEKNFAANNGRWVTRTMEAVWAPGDATLVVPLFGGFIENGVAASSQASGDAELMRVTFWTFDEVSIEGEVYRSVDAPRSFVEFFDAFIRLIETRWPKTGTKPSDLATRLEDYTLAIGRACQREDFEMRTRWDEHDNPKMIRRIIAESRTKPTVNLEFTDRWGQSIKEKRTLPIVKLDITVFVTNPTDPVHTMGERLPLFSHYSEEEMAEYARRQDRLRNAIMDEVLPIKRRYLEEREQRHAQQENLPDQVIPMTSREQSVNEGANPKPEPVIERGSEPKVTKLITEQRIGLVIAALACIAAYLAIQQVQAVIQTFLFGFLGLMLSNAQIPIWLIGLGLFGILAILIVRRIRLPIPSAYESDQRSLAEYEEPGDLEIDLVSLAPIKVSINPAQPTLSVRVRCTNKTRHRIRITGAQIDFYSGVRVTGSVLLDIEVKPGETLGIGGLLNNVGILVECTMNDNARAWFEQNREAGRLGGNVTAVISLTVTVQAEDEAAHRFTPRWSATNFDSRVVWID